MYNLHFLFEYAGDRILQPISRKLHPGAMCTIYTFCSNMRVSAFYSPFFVNCTQVQIFQTGVKKLKITVEYDFSSFCTNYAPPSFGMVRRTAAARSRLQPIPWTADPERRPAAGSLTERATTPTTQAVFTVQSE